MLDNPLYRYMASQGSASLLLVKPVRTPLSWHQVGEYHRVCAWRSDIHVHPGMRIVHFEGYGRAEQGRVGTYCLPCHGLQNRKQPETNKVTSVFYKHMVDESGRLDHTRAAFALRKTMRSVTDAPLDQQILHIHIGT